MLNKASDSLILGELETAVLSSSKISLFLQGWLLFKKSSFTSLRLGIPDSVLADAVVMDREDLAEIYADISHAGKSGFTASITLPAAGCKPDSICFVAELPNGLCLAGNLPLPSFIQEDNQILADRLNNNTPASEADEDALLLYSSQQHAALKAFLSSPAALSFPCHSEYDVSVIIATSKNPAAVFSCLESLAQNSALKIEVFLQSFDSCSSLTEVCSRLQGVNMPPCGASNSTISFFNQAASAAKGKMLLFLDSHCVIFPDTIAGAIKAALAAGPTASIGGKIISPLGKLKEAGGISWQDGSITSYGRGANPFACDFNFIRHVDFCSLAFFLTPKKIFSQLGGFDEEFCLEEFAAANFGLRLNQQGHAVIYHPEVIALCSRAARSNNCAADLRKLHRSRLLLSRKHQSYLLQRPQSLESNEIFGRDSRTGLQHLLFIDDFIPSEEEGSSFYRSLQIVRKLAALGYQITIFPAQGSEGFNCCAGNTLPREVEVVTHCSREDLAGFLESRANFYHYYWISRPHNMQLVNELPRQVRKIIAAGTTIYDSDALYSLREIERLRLLQSISLDQEEQAAIIEEEIALAEAAGIVVSTCEAEALEFLSRGCANVLTLSCAAAVNPSSASFHSRSGILSCLPISEKGCPNEDALEWLCGSIFPLIRKTLLPNNCILSLAGDIKLPLPASAASKEIKLLGRQSSLMRLCEEARVFAAAVRYGSGIPFELITAAAYGIPSVSTSFLASQLGWENEVELLTADTEEEFAAQCCRLYQSEELWNTLRANALKRVAEQFSPQNFERTIEEIMKVAQQCGSSV